MSIKDLANWLMWYERRETETGPNVCSEVSKCTKDGQGKELLSATQILVPDRVGVRPWFLRKPDLESPTYQIGSFGHAKT
jgi:hypothetical protein